MSYTTYFEIHDRIVESHVSTNPSVPSDVNRIAKQPSAVRNGQAKRSKAASPKAIYQPAYTIGVGQGNPMFWLASAALIKGVQMLQPETLTAY